MLLCVALSLLAATAQAMPEQPDFSGRWVLDISASVNPDTTRRLVVFQPITRTNAVGEPMKPAFLRISIRRESVSGNSEEPRLISVIGGTVGSFGDSTRFETVWESDSLVFANLIYGPNGPRTGDWTERREVWSLQQDGRLRVEISTESWRSERRVDVSLYRRENAPQ